MKDSKYTLWENKNLHIISTQNKRIKNIKEAS